MQTNDTNQTLWLNPHFILSTTLLAALIALVLKATVAPWVEYAPILVLMVIGALLALFGHHRALRSERSQRASKGLVEGGAE